MKYPHGWRERNRSRDCSHYAELLDENDIHVKWLEEFPKDDTRRFDEALCKLSVEVAQLASFPDDLLALAFRNRPLSKESWLRMACALRLALNILEVSRRG